MRIAGCSAPLTETSATPSTCESRCATTVSAASYITLGGTVVEVSARIMIGVADGLDLRNDGRDCRSPGRSVSAALIAACTSRAAPSMLRLRSNCTVMRVSAERRARRHLGDAGDLAEPPLQRRRHRLRHGLGIGAGPAGADADGREVDRRHARDRQEVVGDRADQQQPDREQRGADRPADGGLADVHGGPVCAHDCDLAHSGRRELGLLPPPLRGRGGEGGCSDAQNVLPPPSLIPPPQAGEGTLWREPSSREK